MAAPTFVSEYPTAFNNATSPKTAMSAVSINSGDVLIGVAANEADVLSTFTENGSASWVTQQQNTTTAYSATIGTAYVCTGNETLTVTITNTSGFFGGNVVRFSGTEGVGDSNIAQGDDTVSPGTNLPSVTFSTTQDNSAIVVICSDWAAVNVGQTFTNNFGGTATNLTDYQGDGSHYGVAICYFPDAGSAGSKTIGMSAPTGQKWTIVAIEVKGTSGPAPEYKIAWIKG